MSWYELPISNPNTVGLKYGSDQLKLISRYFNGEDLTSTNPVDIGTDTTFDSEALRIRAPSSGFSYIIQGQNIAADRILRLPLMTTTGEIALSAAGAANDWGTATQTFRNQFLEIRNPANTFSYIVNTSAITADRNIILPALTGDDTITFNNATQTLNNKTLNNATFAAITINTDSNTIKHSSTNTAGDILVNNGSKFTRFAKGTAGQVLTVKSDESTIAWIDPAVGGGGGGGGGEPGDFQFPIVDNVISGAWYGTSTTGAAGIWNGFLTNTSNVTPSTITDTTGRIGMRYAFTADDDRAGFRTNDEFFLRANDPEIWVRYRFLLNGNDDDYRVVIGFVENVSADYGSDNALDNEEVFLWFKETSDTVIQSGRNDGDATQNKDGAVSVTSTDENVHTIRLVGDTTNSRYGLSLDGGNFTYYTTEIPAANTRLGCIVQFENEDSNNRFVEIFGAYYKATVI